MKFLTLIALVGSAIAVRHQTAQPPAISTKMMVKPVVEMIQVEVSKTLNGAQMKWIQQSLVDKFGNDGFLTKAELDSIWPAFKERWGFNIPSIYV